MARKKVITSEPERTTILDKENFLTQLNSAIEKGTEIFNREVATMQDLEKLESDYSFWDHYNSELLKSSFNKPSNEYKHSYDRCTMFLGMDDYYAGTYRPHDPNYKVKDFKRKVDAKITNLKQLLSAAKDLIPLENENTKSNKENDAPGIGNIFIIHGHDEAALSELVSIIRDDFKLNPYVLRNLPNNGAPTVIEKFEHYAPQCSMAIALFTPDDVIEKDGERYLQARPNVMYELGWFARHLGRHNTLLLLKQGTTIFSDFQGIIEVRFKTKVIEAYRDLHMEFVERNMVK